MGSAISFAHAADEECKACREYLLHVLQSLCDAAIGDLLEEVGKSQYEQSFKLAACSAMFLLMSL